MPGKMLQLRDSLYLIHTPSPGNAVLCILYIQLHNHKVGVFLQEGPDTVDKLLPPPY